MKNLSRALDVCDTISAIKVTDKRRAWLSAAGPDGRWAVTVHEGGTFSYGRTFAEAFERAMAGKP